MKTTGHEKCRAAVGQAGKGDGTEIKSFFVFEGGKGDVEKLKKDYGNKCIIASSTRGWIVTDLTLSWANTGSRWLLAWDTYECHLGQVFNIGLSKFFIILCLI